MAVVICSIGREVDVYVAIGRGREMATLEERVAYLEGQTGEHTSEMDTRFAWLIGFQFATFMAMIAALLHAYFR